MRVALKIAYDGRAFFGHQRQPDRRTVEGECLAALRAARILRDPKEAFFRSASRTDRGVSAVGNVIAFNTSLRPDAVVGVFNDKARDVWAWAAAQVPDTFHPRLAIERWYRYALLDDFPVEGLQRVARLFEGAHDFRSFTSDPPAGLLTISHADVASAGDAIFVDIRGRSFRRGMIRRIVAAMLAVVRADVAISEVEEALGGKAHDFGLVPPEPLTLMDVRYSFPFSAILRAKPLAEVRAKRADIRLQLMFFGELMRVGLTPGHP